MEVPFMPKAFCRQSYWSRDNYKKYDRTGQDKFIIIYVCIYIYIYIYIYSPYCCTVNIVEIFN